jgi:trimeric autotransporter adhesin
MKSCLQKLVVVVAYIISTTIAHGQTITTYAGNGIGSPDSGAYSGDDGPATAAELFQPVGLAIDASGNLYIADQENNLIRKVTAKTGFITTIAGDTSGGYRGDGGPATAAEFNQPSAVAVDAAGNIYIVDYGNNRIRKITASTGIITTIAGNGYSKNGKAGFSGDGGPADSAELWRPNGVVVDGSGNFYISDSYNNVVRKVDAATNIITTIAGNNKRGYSGDGGAATSAELDYPWGLALDASGNLYISDRSNNRIRKVTVKTGIITTFAGNGKRGFSGDGGPADSAALSFPTGIALDIFGNIYIADDFNHRIRKVLIKKGTITTFAGNGYKNNIGYGGYSGDGGLAINAKLWFPNGLAIDAKGNVFIADVWNNRIRKVSVIATR